MNTLPSQFAIRDKAISPATVLAPMAGVTDTVFRRMIRGLGGCGLIMTEFTSAECITRNAARTSRYLFFEPDEHPITGQLFGAEPQVMARAAAMVEQLGFDIVDINLGCPAKKSRQMRRLRVAARFKGSRTSLARSAVGGANPSDHQDPRRMG